MGGFMAQKAERIRQLRNLTGGLPSGGVEQ